VFFSTGDFQNPKEDFKNPSRFKSLGAKERD
jgi:hypothetical protein